MTIRTKLLTTTLVVGIVSFLTTPSLWPLPPQYQDIPAKLIPWFIGLNIYESIGFGFAIGLVLFGINWIKKNAKPEHQTRLIVLLLVCAWFAGNWWTHDHAHIMTPEGDYSRLLMIEYGYHVTMMIAGIIGATVGFSLYKDLAENQK
jgi:hypothetical protein